MSEEFDLTADLESQINELKRRLAIDTSKLTEALSEQPILALAAAELVVDCIAERDRCKHNLERYAAKHDADLREEAANAREKLTEARIAAMVTSDPGVVGWRQSLIDANELVGNAQALLSSYDQRSWMLRELAKIHGSFEKDRFEGLAQPSE